MGIASDSPLIEVFTELVDAEVPTSTDLEAWTELKPATDDAIVTTAVGLFGADLTEFLDNCATATEECDVTEYENFSGWAIGIEWTAATTTVPIGPSPARLRQAGASSMSSVVFEDQSLLVGVVWKTEDNLLYHSTFDVDVADDAPGYGDLDQETDMDLLNPFTNWSGERVPREDKLQYSIHF